MQGFKTTIMFSNVQTKLVYEELFLNITPVCSRDYLPYELQEAAEMILLSPLNPNSLEYWIVDNALLNNVKYSEIADVLATKFNLK